VTQPMMPNAAHGRHDVSLAFAVFCALAATIVLLWRQNGLLLAATLIEALAALRLWHERYDIVFFLVLAILGTCAEIVFVQSGVWRYANPTLFGIPIWFPLAFGTAGLACERLVTSLAMPWGQRTGAQEQDDETAGYGPG
jgi:uncharacterized membrane protein YoaT (DUF817 family)